MILFQRHINLTLYYKNNPWVKYDLTINGTKKEIINMLQTMISHRDLWQPWPWSKQPGSRSLTSWAPFWWRMGWTGPTGEKIYMYYRTKWLVTKIYYILDLRSRILAQSCCTPFNSWSLFGWRMGHISGVCERKKCPLEN